MNISRRHLLAGSSAATLINLGGGLQVAFGADTPLTPSGVPGTAGNTLVVVFCRFGQDGMQLVAPAGDPDYIQNRPTIRIPSSGAGAGLPLGTIQGTDMFFHPALVELKALYDARQLAPVVAAGILTADRSHFVCQDKMERGISDGEPGQNNGWLARHMASVGGVQPTLSTLAVSTSMPTSLMGDSTALSIANGSSFTVSGGTATTNVTQSLVRGASDYERIAQETLTAVTTVQNALKGVSTANTAGYTTGDLSTPLRSLAQLIKANVGVSVATVDMGGWDHHQNLTSAYQPRAVELSRSLNAFWTDLAAYQNQVTVVTMTEFGRRFQENANHGLDHGSASTMLVMGAGVNGGSIYGNWPGLAASQLYGGDLAVTTDYRQVLSEILTKRHGEANLKSVFPTVAYQPLGLIAG